MQSSKKKKKKEKAENRQTAAIVNDHFSSDGIGAGSPVSLPAVGGTETFYFALANRLYGIAE